MKIRKLGDDFAVIFKIGDYFYMPRRYVDVFAVKPDAIWTFGRPKTKTEKALNDAVENKCYEYSLEIHRLSVTLPRLPSFR